MGIKIREVLRSVRKYLLLKLSMLLRFLNPSSPVKEINADIEREILDGIKYSYAEWQEAISKFENAENVEIIDYYIYRMKAAEIQYNYYVKKAKENNVRLELF